MIRWYQGAVEGRPSPCRFTPSCSAYADEALAVHGVRRGVWLTIRRLARCRPFGPSGYDPIPQTNPTDIATSPSRTPERVRPNRTRSGRVRRVVVSKES